VETIELFMFWLINFFKGAWLIVASSVFTIESKLTNGYQTGFL